MVSCIVWTKHFSVYYVGCISTIVTSAGRLMSRNEFQSCPFYIKSDIHGVVYSHIFNRIDNVMLKSMYRFYDLEIIICEGNYNKHRLLMKQQISAYQKSLNSSRVERQVSIWNIFCLIVDTAVIKAFLLVVEVVAVLVNWYCCGGGVGTICCNECRGGCGSSVQFIYWGFRYAIMVLYRLKQLQSFTVASL